ncbi:MAG TPA: hypothetical protein VHN37_10280 [Actinomycetota bacterium]|nr:hypothetical protein [Actinomycetota bacterium]
MRKLVVLALAATIVASLAPAGANARPALGPQEETGTVVLPGPGPNGPITSGCWTGWGRRAWIFSQGATAGPMASMIEIDPSTWDGKFKLDVVSGGTGTEDLDVTFYIDPGKIDPTDPAMQSGIIESSSYLTREAGGEAGIVPRDTTLVLICLAVGTGYNAEWSYVATPPKKKKK